MEVIIRFLKSKLTLYDPRGLAKQTGVMASIR